MRLNSVKNQFENVGGPPLERSLDGPIHISNLCCLTEDSSIKNIKLRIRRHQKVAIVGQKGAGRSLLLRAMLGLVEPLAGQIQYDGVDVKQIGFRRIRKQVGFAARHAQLFAGTVLENITFSDRSLSFQSVIKAAKLAAFHRDCKSFRFGYESMFFGQGHGLSESQKQRLALARALVREPKILIMDRALRAVEPELEKQIFATLVQMPITWICATNRVETMPSDVFVVVMHEGRIVERGWL